MRPGRPGRPGLPWSPPPSEAVECLAAAGLPMVSCSLHPSCCAPGALARCHLGCGWRMGTSRVEFLAVRKALAFTKPCVPNRASDCRWAQAGGRRMSQTISRKRCMQGFGHENSWNFMKGTHQFMKVDVCSDWPSGPGDSGSPSFREYFWPQLARRPRGTWNGWNLQTVLGPCLCGVSSEVDGVLQSMLACWFVSFWAEVKICCWGSSLVSPQLVTAIPSLHILRKRPNMSMKYSFSSALPLGSGIRVDSAAMRFRGWHFWTSFSRRGFTKMNSKHSRVRPIRSRDWPWV